MPNLDPNYIVDMKNQGFRFGGNSGVDRIFYPTSNFIYLYHTKVGIVLPTWPDNITDSTSVNFQQTIPLGRSAPIYSFSNSGPRSVSFQFQMHRDMLEQTNSSNTTLNPNDDYVDQMIKQVQAAALPNYASSKKMVDPPLVAVRVGNEVFIKGVIAGNVQVSYSGPIMSGKYDDKYAIVTIGFNVTEVDPYDATTVMNIGSYRETPLDTSRLTGSRAVKLTERNSLGVII